MNSLQFGEAVIASSDKYEKAKREAKAVYDAALLAASTTHTAEHQQALLKFALSGVTEKKP